MGEQKVINVKSMAISLVAFIAGFFFSHEIINYMLSVIGYARNSFIPTFVSTFGEAGGPFGFLLAASGILIAIAVIKRWKILNAVEWLIIGVICGIAWPIVYPIVADTVAEKFGWGLPQLTNVTGFSILSGVRGWPIKNKLKNIL